MTDSIATLSVEITADPKALDAALRKVERQLDAIGRDKVDLGAPFARSVPAVSQAERATISFAQARARLLRDQGDLAGAERVLQQSLAATTRTTTQTIGVERQLLKVRQDIERASAGAGAGTSRFASALGGLGTAAGALGLGLGVGALASFAQQAGAASVSLERTQATLRAVAGSQERYNEVLRIAQANQALFGGSLEQNLGPLQQFLFIANRTGASLDQLNQVAQLLATVNPTEGIQGAGFALSEALSGDLTSIVERFNLPRQAVRDLINESANAGEVLSGVTALLAEQGITAETLSASLTENARTYGEFSAAASTAFTEIGNAAATAGRPVADFLTDVLKATSAQIQNTNEAGGVNAAALDPLIQASYEGLTGAVRAYADAQIAAGASTGEALNRALQLSQAVTNLGAAWDGTTAAAADVEARLFAIAGASEQGYQQALFLANQWRDGAISGDQLAASVTALEGSMAASAAATQQQADANTAAADTGIAVADSLLAQADAALQAEAENAALARAQQVLADLGSQVSGGLMAAGDAALVLAQRYGIATGEALRLVQAQAALARAKAVEAAGFAGVPEAYLGAAIGGRAGGGTIGPADTVLGQIAAATSKANAQYQRTLREAEAAERSLTRGGRGGKGGGKGGKSDATKAAEKEAREAAALEEKLLSIQERAADASLDAERAYQERRLEIAEDFARRRADAEESFADDQIATRASFYRSLRGIEDQGQRQALAAQFEQEQAKAADIAATQGADVAQEYLQAITQILQDRARRQAEIAEALKEGNTGDAEFLRGLDALDRQVEDRKVEDILSGKGSLAQQEQAAVGDADAQRQEALAKAAETAGDALAEAQRKGTDAALTHNQALREQIDLLARAGGRPAIAAPATAPAPAATTPAAASAGGTGGAPATSADAAIAVLTQIAASSSQAVAELRRLRSSPNYAPGA